MAEAASSQAVVRRCGDCHRCCDGWLAGEIRGHQMRPGTPCHFMREDRCGIYADRPQTPCRAFVCGWLMPGSPLPEEFRPDLLGVIFVPIVWRGVQAWVLVPAGREPDEDLMARMCEYSRQTGQPHVIKRADRLLCYGAPEFQRDMLERHAQGQPLW